MAGHRTQSTRLSRCKDDLTRLADRGRAMQRSSLAHLFGRRIPGDLEQDCEDKYDECSCAYLVVRWLCHCYGGEGG